MSNWQQAVAEWNKRYYNDGWRSAPAPDLLCPKCKQDRCVTVTTITGKTSAYCQICAFDWKVEP